MIFKIYGHTKTTIKKETWEDKQGEYLGEFDGIDFISDKYQVEDLKEWDFIHVFVGDYFKSHWPKKYNENIVKSLKKLHISEFGEVQQMEMIK